MSKNIWNLLLAVICIFGVGVCFYRGGLVLALLAGILAFTVLRRKG
jgi:hypothetical protein